MNETELEKYEYGGHEGISKSDLFLAEHYEELFYLAPKELAVAINIMNEDELIQFNKTIHRGHGMNVCLMIDKLDELYKYLNVNNVFSNAHWRTSIIDGICSLPDHTDLPYEETFHKIFETFKYFAEDEDDHSNMKVKPYEALSYFYPAFREHFLKLKKAGIIKETENGLKWNLSIISAVQYFDKLECLERSRRWSVIEKVFGFKNLRQRLKNHKEQQRGKTTEDFEKIKKLLDLE
jgi:hypothetical protein